ncbi:FRIGIDA-like protein 2 [Solanum lycopersicum]|uniref:FRIGIDA-like protein 2 n=1 Tax=Solanum lycopersicum TaxID=4081 RepID=UPI003748BCD1
MMADNAATSSANLRKLSDSLLALQCCLTELNQHINSVRSIIPSVIPGLATNISTLLPTSSPPATEPLLKSESSWESDPSEEEEEEKEKKEEEELRSRRSEEVQSPHRSELKSPHSSELKSSRSKEVQFPHRSELESFCKSMNSSELRRYMVMRVSDTNRLLEEVPKALRLSPHPARLVLDSMGKIYFQGRNSYTKNSRMVWRRKAAVLVLECFLLMRVDKVEIEKEVKEEADKAALAWRKRMIAEGGVGKACEMDARGLLLLLGCFGIPGGFSNEDIRDLLLISHITKIYRALRRSNVLKAKIPEIIEGMVKQNSEVDAVHIAYTFRIDRFNPRRILTSFLLNSRESLKKRNEKSEGSLAAVNEAKRKHLNDLTSVIKCLKCHDIDPSKLLPEWKINEKIMALEKEIRGFDKHAERKRKSDETESSRGFRNREAKRSYNPPWVRQQRVDDHVNNNNTLPEGRTTGHLHGYTVSSTVLHGPSAGLIHENIAGSLVGTVGGVAMGVAGAGISPSGNGIHAGISAGTDVVQQGGPYAGGHGGTLVDSTPGQVGSHTDQLYDRSGNAAVNDSLASCSNAYVPSSYLEGSKGLPNTTHTDAYRSPPYSEGSTRLPNAISSDAAGRSFASDIYQVADTDKASELHMSSGVRAVDTVSSAASAHPSSNLHQPK